MSDSFFKKFTVSEKTRKALSKALELPSSEDGSNYSQNIDYNIEDSDIFDVSEDEWFEFIGENGAPSNQTTSVGGELVMDSSEVILLEKGSDSELDDARVLVSNETLDELVFANQQIPTLSSPLESNLGAKNMPKQNELPKKSRSTASSLMQQSSSRSSLSRQQQNPLAAKAFLGPKTVFKGELSGHEDIAIHGVFEGNINLPSNKLYVGENAKIHGTINAKDVLVGGFVEGELHGKETVVVQSSSQVIGKIVANRVSLEDGAKFRGSIEMDFDEADDSSPTLNKDSASKKGLASDASSPEGSHKTLSKTDSPESTPEMPLESDADPNEIKDILDRIEKRRSN